MSEIHTIAPQRGLASGTDGALLDMPRELAHTISGELLATVTLLHASMREAGQGDADADEDGMTCSSSRAVALIAMADDKVRGVLRAMGPYV